MKNKRIYEKDPSICEENFLNLLCDLSKAELTADDIKSNKKLKNYVAEITYDFFRNKGICSERNIALIKRTGIEYEEFAIDATLRCIDNLDKILAKKSGKGMVAYCMTICNNIVTDKFRKWCSIYPVIESEDKDDTGNRLITFYGMEGEKYFFEEDVEEADSRMIAVETASENKSYAKAMFEILTEKPNPLDFIAFASIVPGYKPSQVADMLITYGVSFTVAIICTAVLVSCKYLSAEMFNTIFNESKNITTTFKEKDSKQISAMLSRRRNNVKNELYKKLVKEYADLKDLYGDKPRKIRCI